jgi:hypothetical protein
MGSRNRCGDRVVFRLRWLSGWREREAVAISIDYYAEKMNHSITAAFGADQSLL